MAGWLTIVDSIRITPILTALQPNDFNVELGLAMGKLLDRAHKAAKMTGKGDWVIRSQALAIVGDRLVVSFLFGR